MSSYLKVVYNEKTHPYTGYPEKLCHFLFQQFGMSPGMTFIEVGCGRGEFLAHFQNLGLDICGMDVSADASTFLPDIPIKTGNVEHEGIPYPDSSFDIVYSKSFIEHLYYPERFVQEAHRILKPGGLFLNLVPDWTSQYKTYFDDYTHRTPFTKVALEDIYKIFGFTHVEVFKFRQLPIVWRYPVLNYFCTVISPFIPVRTQTKFLRWSRELMLIGSGRKTLDI
jgi:SAM-dependent methyltransferase